MALSADARITDRLPSFSRSAFNVLNDALKEAGRDTLVNARRTAPFRKGPLRSNSIVSQVLPLHQRVSFWMEYARYQEFGGDKRRTIRSYSTPGTKAHFLRDAGDHQAKQFPLTLKKHARRATA